MFIVRFILMGPQERGKRIHRINCVEASRQNVPYSMWTQPFETLDAAQETINYVNDWPVYMCERCHPDRSGGS